MSRQFQAIETGQLPPVSNELHAVALATGKNRTPLERVTVRPFANDGADLTSAHSRRVDWRIFMSTIYEIPSKLLNIGSTDPIPSSIICGAVLLGGDESMSLARDCTV